jgi:hypothetical protein
VFNGTDTLTGAGGATATIGALDQSPNLIEEISAGWKVVNFGSDLHVVLTNEDSPTGGRAGFLDELGNERGLPRFDNELDSDYRDRVSKPADVVSPGAIIRAVNRLLEPFGEEVCLREVGRPLFRGMFYDTEPSAEPFAFDLGMVDMSIATPGFQHREYVRATDADGLITRGRAQIDPTSGNFVGVVRAEGPGFVVSQTLVGETSGHASLISTVGIGLNPTHRFYLLLNLVEFRGFFLVGVPPAMLESFGAFYDEGDDGAFDTNELSNFLDGESFGTDELHTLIYEETDSKRAAGVRFDLYVEDIGCV